MTLNRTGDNVKDQSGRSKATLESSARTRHGRHVMTWPTW